MRFISFPYCLLDLVCELCHVFFEHSDFAEVVLLFVDEVSNGEVEFLYFFIGLVEFAEHISVVESELGVGISESLVFEADFFVGLLYVVFIDFDCSDALVEVHSFTVCVFRLIFEVVSFV